MESLRNPASSPSRRRPPSASLVIVLLCTTAIIAILGWMAYERLAPLFEGMEFLTYVFSAIGLIVSLLGAVFSSKPVRRSMGPGRSARILSRIPATYRRIKNVETPAGVLDEVFVAPAGLFALTARTPMRSARVRRGALIVDGEQRDDAAASIRVKARMLEESIGTPVTPVLFFHGVEFASNARVEGVEVCGATGLVHLLRGSNALTQDQVRALSDLVAGRALLAQ